MADSKRKDILQAVVTTLVTIDGAGDFITDFSTSGQVALKPFQGQQRAFRRWIWVHDGEEIFEKGGSGISPRIDRAFFGVLLEVTIKTEGTQTLVEQLNDVLHDIHLAINADPSLGLTCSEVWVDLIDIPLYEEDGTTAIVAVHLTAEYSFEPKSEI